jgi:hypothetical protein
MTYIFSEVQPSNNLKMSFNFGREIAHMTQRYAQDVVKNKI